MCSPPKVAKRVVSVSARRMQVVLERLSPAISQVIKFPSDGKNDEATAWIAQTFKVNEIKYYPVDDYPEETKESCQRESRIPVPSCARPIKNFF